MNQININTKSLLNAVLQTTPAIISFCDRNWVYQFVNENYEKWFGVKKEELLGKNAIEILGIDGANKVRPFVERCLSGELVTFEKEVHYEKIGLRFVRTSYVPERNAQSEVIGFFVITFDLTSEHKALLNFQAKSLEEERMLDCIPMMIGQWDKNLLNVQANKVYKEFFGIPKESIKGKHIREVLGEELYIKNLPYMELVLSGVVQNFERAITLPNGEIRFVLASYIPNIVAGNVEGFFVLVTDISEVKNKSRLIEEQKKFYSEILNSLQEGFTVQDKMGKIIYFNESAANILGLTHDQLMGKTSFDADWRAVKEEGEDFPGEEHPSIQTIKTGKPIYDTIMGVNIKDANTRWININSFPFNGIIENQEASVLCTFENISEKFKNDKLIAGVIKNSPGIIYQFKLTPENIMSFPYANAKVFEIFELTPEEFKSDANRVMSMVEEKEREGLYEEIFKSANLFIPFEWKGRIKTLSGKEKWLNIKSIPHKEYDGSIVWDGLMTDVTDEVNLLNDLSLERVRAVHMSKLASLGEMSAGVAHEINNPLTIIKGMTSSLHRSLNDPTKFQEKIITIEKSIQRISKIVNGLKRFSRKDEKTPRRKYSVQDIFSETLSYLELKAGQEFVELTFDIPPDLIIDCDPLEIEQVVINLVINAIDAVRNYEKKWVKVEAFKENQFIFIHVIDSGMGIPSDIANKIFDPFFTTKEVGKGTGLGLSLSNTIIKDHDGLIYIDTSRPNTCFAIRLPSYNYS